MNDKEITMDPRSDEFKAARDAIVREKIPEGWRVTFDEIGSSGLMRQLSANRQFEDAVELTDVLYEVEDRMLGDESGA